MEEMEGKIKEAFKETKEGREERDRRQKGWWDEECKDKKREVRRKSRDWRKEKEGG